MTPFQVKFGVGSEFRHLHVNDPDRYTDVVHFLAQAGHGSGLGGCCHLQGTLTTGIGGTIDRNDNCTDAVLPLNKAALVVAGSAIPDGLVVFMRRGAVHGEPQPDWSAWCQKEW